MKILSAEQTRCVDGYTIVNEPIKSIDLMERASAAFVNWFTTKFNSTVSVLVVVGSGNNGGDGLAIARLLHKKSYVVEVLLASPKNTGSEDYQFNLGRLPTVIKKQETFNANCDVIIDGVFGSGISRPITGELAKLIESINSAEKKIVSIDIASGLSPEGGAAQGIIIQPTFTVSFQLPKKVFLLPENDEYVGNWSIVDIGLDKLFIDSLESSFYYFTEDDARTLLKPRLKFAHKGTFGHALIVGGSFGKVGANVLASKACLKSGAGLVTSLVPNCGYHILQTVVPEVMCLVSGENHLINLKLDTLTAYSALGIGPGIGTNLETLSLLVTLLKECNCPIVLDADALNLLSQNPELIELVPKGSVLTPHVGEFNRLLGKSNSSTERIEKQKEFAIKHQLIIVLKGAHTSIANIDGTIWFNSTGNPGMATAGSGDVLTGMITSFLAQGYNSLDAARLGVYLHGKAADIASSELGQASLIASDITERISSAFISLN